MHTSGTDNRFFFAKWKLFLDTQGIDHTRFLPFLFSSRSVALFVVNCKVWFFFSKINKPGSSCMWKSLYENGTFCLQLLAETSNFGKHEDLGVHLSFYSVPKIVDISANYFCLSK